MVRLFRYPRKSPEEADGAVGWAAGIYFRPKVFAGT